MKILVALVMGFFSGLLIYMAGALLLTSGAPSTGFVFVTFFGGWAISTFIIVRGARSLSRVFSRGFLIGAAEWLAMIPVSIIYSGKTLTETVSENAADAEIAVATIAAGLFSALTGGLAVGMALVCLLGFAVSYFMGREMQPETTGSTRACPECAEQIQAAARKCRFCGAALTPQA